ncbi:hypothetical protein DSO57_1034871 [Entomophthora muscae]|uniref:Uncharacterized protein n=1 Tax=Entomophthora muscae TaxID=34485 RepID=A0ACC2UKU1_9FUNG|nr:hypothetical protein DSO57_1034871 [Entomophthora muscae]
MRETNSSNPHVNRATKTMSNSAYERPAINCTTVVPLLSSLNHLIYLTSTSSKTRDTIVNDGGLEQLIHILNTTKVIDVRSGWKWSMAYQCVVNIGVRGNEAIRKRVVEAGAIPIVINILETFLTALEHIRAEKDRGSLPPTAPLSGLVRQLRTIGARASEQDAPITSQDTTIDVASTTIEIAPSGLPFIRSGPQTRSITQQLARGSSEGNSSSLLQPPRTSNSSTILPSSPRPSHLMELGGQFISHSSEDMGDDDEMEEESEEGDNMVSPPSWLDQVLYREEDILLSLQLLAYLSKYPSLRHILHSGYEPINVFRLVEQFTSRAHANEVQYWSGIIMRNACRKDDGRGGLRQCAFMSCGRWEMYPREFAKCRRCRKAKYCSKVCQSRAWTEGHRYWCVERTSEVPSTEDPSSVNTSNPTSAASAPGSAISQMPSQDPDHHSLETAGLISEGRPIDP